jgi:hypothetical protein
VYANFEADSDSFILLGLENQQSRMRELVVFQFVVYSVTTSPNNAIAFLPGLATGVYIPSLVFVQLLM